MDENASNKPLIYAAISRVMADIGAVGKDRKNLQQNYQFRGIEDVLNAAQPALVKHEVFCAPKVKERLREERPTKSGGVMFYTTLTVRHRFFTSDGSHVDVVTVGEAMDAGDKSSNKAMSAAYKYALVELFAIPTKEAIDTESDSPEPGNVSSPQSGNGNGRNQDRQAEYQAAREAKAQAERDAKAAEDQRLFDEVLTGLAESRTAEQIDCYVPSAKLLARSQQMKLSPIFKAARERVAQLEDELSAEEG